MIGMQFIAAGCSKYPVAFSMRKLEMLSKAKFALQRITFAPDQKVIRISVNGV